MISILHISSPLTWRGGERQIANLISSLNKKDVKQILLCPTDSQLANYCKKNTIHYQTLPKTNGISLNWARTIKNICRSQKITHIHVHDSKSHTFAITAATLYRKIPKIIISRRVIFPIKNKFLTRYKYTHPNIETIICISKAVELVVKKAFPNATTSIIPSSITISKYNNTKTLNTLKNDFKLESNSILIGYVAALTSEKDHFTFVKTAKILINKNENYHFFIIGEGDQRQAIEKFILDNKLDNRIHLTGFIQDIDVVIPQLDLLLFTSTSEGLGSSILDFFLAKIPVVSTRCGGTEELIEHGKTGFLAAIYDSEKLAEYVQKILTNSLLSKKITDNAFQYIIKNHSKEQMGLQTLEVYQKSLDQPSIDLKKYNDSVKISAIIPTFNEEDVIENAIKSVDWVDEIIIIDSFSTDNTLNIAKKFDVRIVQREYNYSASQKNWIIPQAKNKWILLLDADETVSHNLRDEIRQVLESNKNNYSGYWIKRTNFFMGKKIRFGSWKNDKVIRLFKRDKCRYEDKKVHAEIINNQKFGILTNNINHYTYKNLDNFIKRQNRYSKWKAVDKYANIDKITIYHFLIRPIFNFIHSFIFKLGFLDGKQGFIISAIDSYSIFLRYLYIWRNKNGEGIE